MFSRQPDLFDGEKAPAIIQQVNQKKKVQFVHNGNTFTLQLSNKWMYPLGNATVIYPQNKPQEAKVYQWLGYIITPGELITSIILLLALLFVAKSITHNPSEQAIKDQLNYPEPNKTKYDL